MILKNQILVEKIDSILQEGIALSQKDLHFIDATFAKPTAEELFRILSDPDSSDAQTLYELLLFPDERLQTRLESDLEQNKYSQEDVHDIVERLIQQQICIPVILPDIRGKISICAPAHSLFQFVSRLNISYQLDETIAQAITRVINDRSDYLLTRVKFRNSRFECLSPISGFLCDLIEKIYPDEGRFWDALNFMLDFFGEQNSVADIFSALLEYRQVCVQLLSLAEKKATALKEKSIEALMMNRDYIPPVNIEQIRKNIVLIDYICLKIYGSFNKI